MWELVDRLHKALNIESTGAFVLIMGLICAALFGVLGAACAWIVDAGYKNSAEYKASHEKPALPKSEAVAAPVASQTAAAKPEQSTARPKPEPKRLLKQHGNKNVGVNGDIHAEPGSNVQVGNGNKNTTINIPPKALVPCDDRGASIVVCNSEDATVNGTKVYGGPETTVKADNADRIQIENTESHKFPTTRLDQLFTRGMWLSDDCQRKKNGVAHRAKDIHSDEDLRLAIVRWKNFLLPALKQGMVESNVTLWTAAFGDQEDPGTSSLEEYCKEVDYNGPRMTMLKQFRGDQVL